MNKIIILGRITKDLELSQGKNEKSYTNFSVAVNRKLNRDVADFFNCTAFGKTAEYICKYGSKGSQVLIEGEVNIDQYEGKYYTKIMCQSVSLVGSRESQETSDDEKVEQTKRFVKQEVFNEVEKDTEDFYKSSIDIDEDLDLPF